MAKYIDKDAIVTEIERYKHKADERLKIKNRALLEDMKDLALQNLCGNLLNFINTLEVKEIYEHNDSDLDSILEEIGLEHDSKLAKMFKTAFYKSIDDYLEKKGE